MATTMIVYETITIGRNSKINNNRYQNRFGKLSPYYNPFKSSRKNKAKRYFRHSIQCSVPMTSLSSEYLSNSFLSVKSLMGQFCQSSNRNTFQKTMVSLLRKMLKKVLLHTCAILLIIMTIVLVITLSAPKFVKCMPNKLF